MQIGIGGAAGDAYDPLRHYLPNPALGPHDPTTAVAARRARPDQGQGRPHRPADRRLPPLRPRLQRHRPRSRRLRRPRHRRRPPIPRQRTDDLRRRQRPDAPRRPAAPATSTRSRTPTSRHHASTKASTTAAPGRSTRSALAASSSSAPPTPAGATATAGSPTSSPPAPTPATTSTSPKASRRPSAGPAHRSRPTDRHLQRPLDRDRIRARPRRPRTRTQRLPRRRRHGGRASDESGPPAARGARRDTRSDRLQRTMPHRQRPTTEPGLKRLPLTDPRPARPEHQRLRLSESDRPPRIPARLIGSSSLSPKHSPNRVRGENETNRAADDFTRRLPPPRVEDYLTLRGHTEPGHHGARVVSHSLCSSLGQRSPIFTGDPPRSGRSRKPVWAISPSGVRIPPPLRSHHPLLRRRPGIGAG